MKRETLAIVDIYVPSSGAQLVIKKRVNEIAASILEKRSTQAGSGQGAR